jgi:hypothetical protein
MGPIKRHILLDLCGNIPEFIHVLDKKMHDVNIPDMLIPDARSFCIMDRAYVDFERFCLMNQFKSFFVTRADEKPGTGLIFELSGHRSILKLPRKGFW